MVFACQCVPQRYILCFMGFLAIVNAYTMRVALSIAITEMVMPVNTTGGNEYEDVCGVGELNSFSTNAVTDPDKLYPWDERTQGLILGAFYWGYLITHIPGGVLASKFGGKYVLGLGILSTGVFTVLTPQVVLMTKGDWKWVCVLRLLEGLGEGTTYPALNTLLAQWVPLRERSKMGALVYAGSQIGTIVCNLCSGYLIKNVHDWSIVFYVFGAGGIIWFLFFEFLCYSHPRSHPFLSIEEREYLEAEMVGVSSERPPIPWKAIFTSAPVYALIAAQIGHDWGFYTMISDLPKYMKDVLRFDVAQNGNWNSIPYCAMWVCSSCSGYLCDWVINHKVLTATNARKFFTTFAAVVPAIFIMAASYAKCDTTLAVWMFTLAMGAMGPYYCGMRVNSMDLSPNFAGVIMAITNGIGAATGIITPYLTGALTDHHTVSEWRTVFWISFFVFMVTSAIYVLFASAKEQSWNKGQVEE